MSIRKVLFMILFAGIAATGCKKKKSGICYCKYLSGDKKEFNMTMLDRAKAEDSCNRVINNNASAFAGSCELK